MKQNPVKKDEPLKNYGQFILRSMKQSSPATLSRFDMFVCSALQGLLADSGLHLSHEQYADEAVGIAAQAVEQIEELQNKLLEQEKEIQNHL